MGGTKQPKGHARSLLLSSLLAAVVSVEGKLMAGPSGSLITPLPTTPPNL